jgi:hypothetical protein
MSPWYLTIGVFALIGISIAPFPRRWRGLYWPLSSRFC